jgi:YidC/Oxa1 family membrane protein insertase
MDRKSLIIVISCVALMLAWSPISNKLWPPLPAPATPEPTQNTGSQDSAKPLPLTQPIVPELREAQASPTVSTSSDAYRNAKIQTSTSSDLARFDFVAEGGGIREVTLLTQRAQGEDRVTLNTKGPGPLFQIRGVADAWETGTWKVSNDGQRVVMDGPPHQEIRPRKEFTLLGDYRSLVTLSFSNTGKGTQRLPDFYVNVGTSAPIHETDMPLYIGLDWFDGNSSTHKKLTDFQSSSLLFIPMRGARPVIEETLPLRWLTSRNQFYVTLAQPLGFTFAGYRGEQIILPKFRPAQTHPPEGVLAWGRIAGMDIPPGQTVSLKFSTYTGPREYWRLRDFGEHAQRIMDFGFWAWVSVTLLNTMNFLHGLVPNYGVAIILMVIVIKGVFWPLQSKANKTMKQMQALQPRLKELQEKFKDDPQKLQLEMMEVYRNYGVNPMGGCLPMLVQIPVFFGFYAMLQSAVELRDAQFLWIRDLSQPDTIWTIPGLEFPVNILPLVMGATSVWQMNITPNTSMDKTQAMMLKLMPLIFVVICYNFSSALALYWTVQNLIGVAQLYHNLSEPAPKLEKVKARPKTRWAMLLEQAKQQAEMEKQQRRKKK